VRSPVVLLAAAALAVGCSGDPDLPAACLVDETAYAEALRAAPGDVRLEGTTPISDCLRHVRDDGQLQTLGLTLSAVADELAAGARDGGDAREATQLGYLVGAVRRGSTGVTQQLARRIDLAGARVLRARDAVLTDALGVGQAAGKARG
jgi:hypothetical protein